MPSKWGFYRTISKNWLIENYINKSYSSKKCAEILKCSYATILRALVHRKILIRDCVSSQIGRHPLQENAHNWKGGNPKCNICNKYISYGCKNCKKCKSEVLGARWKNKDFVNLARIKRRHDLGKCKKYQHGLSHTNEYKKAMRAKRRALDKDLNIKIVQMVYEDNIKKYGTLTCYLCLNPIQFRKDHLEHKIPLSRGGTNLYDNLAVACQGCNCRKNCKTEEEFRKAVLNICQ